MGRDPLGVCAQMKLFRFLAWRAQLVPRNAVGYPRAGQEGEI